LINRFFSSLFAQMKLRGFLCLFNTDLTRTTQVNTDLHELSFLDLFAFAEYPVACHGDASPPQ